MRSKLLIGFIMMILFSLSVLALSTSNLGNAMIKGNATVNGTYLNVSNGIIYGNGSGISNIVASTMAWTGLNTYPSACPSYSYLTQLDDSVTCSAISTINNTLIIETGNLNVSDGNITNVNYIYPTYLTGATDVNSTNFYQNGNAVCDVSGFTMAGNINASGNNVTNLDRITGDGSYVKIGTTSAAKGMTDSASLFVGSRFEVAGQTDFPNTVIVHSLFRINDGQPLRFGTGNDAEMKWGTANSVHAFVLGLGNTDKSFLLTTYALRDTNFGHSAQATPTMFFHSNNSASNQWMSLTHNQTDGVIDTGLGDVIVKTNLDITGNITGNSYYGEMYIYQNDTATSFASQNVYYNITNGMQEGMNNGFTYANGILTATIPGKYKIDSSVSFSGTANNEYHIAVGLNFVNQDKCHSSRKLGAGGDVGNVGMACFIQISNGDDLTLMMENIDSAGDPTIIDAQFNLIRIGD